MKQLILLGFFLLTCQTVYAQDVAPAPEDMAVVYFVRPSFLGLARTFTFFDGDKAIGRFGGVKYMRYTCPPGEHLFWALAENKSFVKADLKAGHIYIIESEALLAALSLSVKLRPVDVKTYDFLGPIQRLVSKKPPVTFTPKELAQLQSKKKKAIERRLEKYDKINPDRVLELHPNMTAAPEDFVLVKKKK